MAELTINQLIKIIIGIILVIAVVWGVYYVFNTKVIGFIENVGPGNSSLNLILYLI